MRRRDQCCEDVPGENGLNTSAQGKAYPKSAVRGSFERGVSCEKSRAKVAEPTGCKAPPK
eukprot:2011776-Pyramimonas_sp.AAC.1